MKLKQFNKNMLHLKKKKREKNTFLGFYFFQNLLFPCIFIFLDSILVV